MIAIIIVVVVITAGVLGWMFAKKSQVPTKQVAVTQSIVSAAQTQPTQMKQAEQDQNTIAKEGRKSDKYTYTDNTYGFSFQYPARVGEFRVETSDDGGEPDIKYPTKLMKFYLSTTDPQHPEKEYVALHIWISSVDQIRLLTRYCSDNSDDADIYVNQCQIIDMTDPAGENSQYVFRTRGFVTFDPLYNKPKDALTDEEFSEMIKTFAPVTSE